MEEPTPLHYAAIDWEALRQRALAEKGWQEKGPAEWDKKALSFAGRNKSSAYIDLFLARLPLDPALTILDIGSGPGTLALPLAEQVKSVTAVDFSPGMLALLRDQATIRGLDNIRTVCCAWEDDWEKQGITPHDLVIASRALGVRDLRGALAKLNHYASKWVYLTDKIGATPFDPEAFAALGRPFVAGPDYIYTLNILYTLNIHPNMIVLELEQELHFTSLEEAMASYSWMFQALTPRETDALREYIVSHTVAGTGSTLTVRRKSPPRWALIWWQKESTVLTAAPRSGSRR